MFTLKSHCPNIRQLAKCFNQLWVVLYEVMLWFQSQPGNVDCSSFLCTFILQLKESVDSSVCFDATANSTIKQHQNLHLGHQPLLWNWLRSVGFIRESVSKGLNCVVHWLKELSFQLFLKGRDRVQLAQCPLKGHVNCLVGSQWLHENVARHHWVGSFFSLHTASQKILFNLLKMPVRSLFITSFKVSVTYLCVLCRISHCHAKNGRTSLQEDPQGILPLNEQKGCQLLLIGQSLSQLFPPDQWINQSAPAEQGP